MRIPKTLLTLLMAGAMSFLSPKSNAQILPDKINPFRQPNQLKEIVWDTLSTRAQRENLHIQDRIIDKTDTLKYISGKWESANFAKQTHLNFYGFGNYTFHSEDTTFIYDTTNIGRFNLPLYYVTVSSSFGGHGMNAILVGDSSVNWSDWDFVEPQTDEVVQPGSQSIPPNSTVKIRYLSWFYEPSLKRNLATETPFLTFNIVDGVPTLASYDTTRLVLERNFAPGKFSTVSPASGAQFPSCNDSINFVWKRSIDRDPADAVKYKLKIRDKNTGPETIFSDITDTTNVLHSRTLTRGNYDWSVEASDGKEVAYSDTAGFSIGNTAPTQPTFTFPKDSATVSFDKGILHPKHTQATDIDNDNLEYIITATGPKSDNSGADTTYVFTTTADSISIDGKMLKPLSKYTLEGKVTDGTDTTSFTQPLTFYTPTVTGIERINEKEIIAKHSLSQNYPNPFNPVTNIRYSIPKTTEVSLKVYDMLGREVETLVDGVFSSGEYNVDFDASKLSSGVYMYRLKAGDFIETKKMVVGK